MSVLYAPNPTGELAKQAAAHTDRLRRLHIIQKPVSAVVTEFVELHPDLSVEQPSLPNALLEAAWEALEPRGHASVFKCEFIQRRVLEHFHGISRVDLIGHRRTANVVLPRQIAMYLCKVLTTRSLPDIGRRFGNRDHTTVLHAVRKVEALLQSRPDVANVVEQIITSLQPDRVVE